MEVTSLCITQLISVLVLMSAQVQHSCSHKADATFPRIVPSRLQLFEYESVFINCEGFFNDLIEWRVMRKIKGTTTICNNHWETTGPCSIETAYSADSGEYWCEAGGKKSNTVNITVTAGSVILESPALPVMEGEDVTLRCRNKTSNVGADFYKDDLFINTVSAGELTIHSVSKSDEGLYKCSIPGAGKSAESWLAVRAGSVILESPGPPVMEGEAVTLICRSKTTSSIFTADFYKDGLLIGNSSTGNMTIHSVSKSDEGLYKCNISGHGESAESWLAVRAYQEERPDSGFPRVFTLLRMVVIVLLAALLLLLVVAVLHYKKHKELTVAELQEFPNPVVTGPRNEKDADEPLSRAVYYTLGLVKTQQDIKTRPVASRAAWTSVPSTSTEPHLTEEDCYYYTII